MPSQQLPPGVKVGVVTALLRRWDRRGGAGLVPGDAIRAIASARAEPGVAFPAGQGLHCLPATPPTRIKPCQGDTGTPLGHGGGGVS